jgi:hypothetical protein
MSWSQGRIAIEFAARPEQKRDATDPGRQSAVAAKLGAVERG